ncbi:MAG: pseudouridine-5'-phosphate glycosidase [Proteobacteria bacterium]|nr:pseudouridine-5'-phosphate glycosidase [Pseudomonadota bacterium]MDA0993752.1 pseudouridine-5'-phosphate glycosidase [Pseudomonadota bacterium]
MHNSGRNYLEVHRDVRDALDEGRAVVALESTIICHGMPYPRNVDTAKRVESIVRANGAVPATIAILDGQLKVGLEDSEIEYLGRNSRQVTKASRRDLPIIVSRRGNGATTVAATMTVATMAGIRVMATGGIGGVHRGVEQSMDVSADLDALSRTNIAVVCAGIKSVLDIGRTLECLETAGVPVLGYRTDTVPAFYSSSSGFPVDYRMDEAHAIAAALRCKFDLGINGAILVTNPVPDEHALNGKEIDQLIDEAITEMNKLGITGKATTPFLLARIAERTNGRSLDTNIELVLNNAKLAANIALEYSRLVTRDNEFH